MRKKKQGFIKKIVSFILVISLIMGLVPFDYLKPITVRAAESSVVYTDRSATGKGSGTEGNPYKYFVDALSAVAEGGTIIIGSGGAFINEEVSLAPLIIDKEVTIAGETGASIEVRPAGIVLGADVTFENVAIGLGNRHNNAIFANGYTLTLTNVTRENGAREIHLFAGGLYGSGAAAGTHGKIIINGTSGQFGNIYAGGMNEAWALDSSITINGTASMNIGELYACGAQTGVYEADDLFSGAEPESPAASATYYPMSGAVAFALNDISIDRVYGLAEESGLSDADNKADVVISTKYARENMELADIGTLVINSGTVTPNVLNEGVNISIKEDGILDLSKVTAANSNTFSGNNFEGGGILRLGKEDVFTITGNVTGSTTFEVSSESVLSGSGVAAENHGYIDVSAATGDGVFTFTPYSAQEGMELIKQDGVWTTSEPVIEEVKMTDFDIQADVKESGLEVPKEDIAENGDICFGVTGSFAPENAYTDIGLVKFNYRVLYNGELYEAQIQKDSYDYYIGVVEELNLCFSPIGFVEDGDAVIYIYRLDDAKPVSLGDYTITVNAPVEDDAIGVIEREVNLRITGEQPELSFEDGIRTYLGEVATNTFCYGDAITVKLMPKISQVSVADSGLLTSDPSANQIALYVDDVQLTEPRTVVNGTELTFVIDTLEKNLAIGETTITAKYVGDGEIPDYSESFTVTLCKKTLTVTEAIAENRSYDGTQKVVITGVVLEGICKPGGVADDVFVELTDLEGIVSSANVGEYGEVVLPFLMLGGDHTDYYVLTQPEEAVGLRTVVVISKKSGATVAPIVNGSYQVDTEKNKYVYTITAVEGAEYQMDGQTDGKWTENNVFQDIAPETTHIFYARIKETANVEVGAVGNSGQITFPVISTGDEEDTPSNPGDTPTEPGDTPSNPEDTPSDPGDTPSNPEDTPTEPEDTPSNPEDTPSNPEDTPSNPEDTPNEPEDTPSEPEDTPNEPEDTPSEPEDTPNEPEDKPSEPEDTPNEPEDKPSEPEDTPSEPGDTPSNPEGTPDDGGDTVTQVGDLTCIDGKYYFYEDGETVTSKEAFVNGAWRWFDADGTMATDKDVYQQSSGGKWVRYNENGEMIKGEDYRYDGWYYFEPITGTMVKGPVVLEDGRKVFYDTITGQMLKGEHNINGQTYVFDEMDGHLISGTDTGFWIWADGKQYWYENWQRQGWEPANDTYRGKEIYDPASDAWYWLDNVQHGGKAVNKDVYQESYSAYPDREDGTGKWVRYDENGHMIKGWQITDAGTYYFEPITGAMAKGTVVIEGVAYTFDVVTGIRQ